MIGTNIVPKSQHMLGELIPQMSQRYQEWISEDCGQRTAFNPLPLNGNFVSS